MATLSDEHLRASPRQLGWLVYAGFAKLRRTGGYMMSAKEFRVKITEAGRNAIAE
jgi:hypothetical protein